MIDYQTIKDSEWKTTECVGWEGLSTVRDSNDNILAACVPTEKAQLIAASPELLSELTSILRCFDRDNISANHFTRLAGAGARVFITYSQIERVRAVIAEATRENAR